MLERDEGDDRGGRVPDEPLGARGATPERDPHEHDRGDLRNALEHGQRVGAGSGEVLRAAARRPPERGADGVVDGEQHPRAEALDLEWPAELTADRVEHTVRGRDEERKVGDDDRCDDESQHGPELAASAPAPRDDPDERHEDGRVELDRDSDADDEGAGAEPARDQQEHRPRDDRRRNEIEARQDHAPEQQRDERDDGQRDATVGESGAEPAETGGEEEDTDRAGERHLRGEHDAEGGEGVGDERREDERRERSGRILECEVAVRDETVRDALAVGVVERDVGYRAAAQLPGDGRRHRREHEHRSGEERVAWASLAVAHVEAASSGCGSRGRNSASSTNGSTQGR